MIVSAADVFVTFTLKKKVPPFSGFVAMSGAFTYVPPEVADTVFSTVIERALRVFVIVQVISSPLATVTLVSEPSAFSETVVSPFLQTTDES